MRAEANEKRPNLKIEERCSRRKTTRKKENDDLKGLVILLETGILLKVMKRIAFQEKKRQKKPYIIIYVCHFCVVEGIIKTIPDLKSSRVFDLINQNIFRTFFNL